MAEIFIKRTDSDLNGNYWGMNIKRISIELEKEEVYAEARKEYRDSTDSLITAKAYKRYLLPESAYGSLLTASKITTLTNWVDSIINAPEPDPEA